MSTSVILFLLVQEAVLGKFVHLAGNYMGKNPVKEFHEKKPCRCEHFCTMEKWCNTYALKKVEDGFICQLLSENSTIVEDPERKYIIAYSDAFVSNDFKFAVVTRKTQFLRAMGEGLYTTARDKCRGDGLAHLVMDNRGQEWHDYVLEFMESHFPSHSKFWIGADDLDWDNNLSWVDDSLVVDSIQTFWLPGEPDSKDGNQNARCLAMEKSRGGKWEDVSCSKTLPITCEIRLP